MTCNTIILQNLSVKMSVMIIIVLLVKLIQNVCRKLEMNKLQTTDMNTVKIVTSDLILRLF